MELSGILLMFVLGVRHGFDPDHIAIIDGISVRYSQIRPVMAKWSGTLFAIGHGAVITGVAVMISLFSHSWTLPEKIWAILDWIPGILLLLVGYLNLRVLLSRQTYRPQGIKASFLPPGLKRSSHPVAIVLTGILFALVFDTNTQVAAWAYSGSSEPSTVNAMVLGMSFTTGMILTDTLDSRILFALMLQSAHKKSVLHYRRALGWITVYISFIAGAYKIAGLLFPAMVLEETTLTVMGVTLFLLMLIFYSFIFFYSSRRCK